MAYEVFVWSGPVGGAEEMCRIQSLFFRAGPDDVVYEPPADDAAMVAFDAEQRALGEERGDAFVQWGSWLRHGTGTAVHVEVHDPDGSAVVALAECAARHGLHAVDMMGGVLAFPRP